VEILRLDSLTSFTLRDLAELEHYGNLKEAHLRWFRGPSVTEFLPILERCINLRRITLENYSSNNPFSATQEKLCEFIMKLKHLTFLHIIYNHLYHCNNFKSEVDEVKALVIPRRPNFKFYVSCCAKFDKSRVGSCVFLF